MLISNFLSYLLSNRNQPLKSADGLHIGVLKNKVEA
jgi:hypothetical protein